MKLHSAHFDLRLIHLVTLSLSLAAHSFVIPRRCRTQRLFFNSPFLPPRQAPCALLHTSSPVACSLITSPLTNRTLPTVPLQHSYLFFTCVLLDSFWISSLLGLLDCFPASPLSALFAATKERSVFL